VVFCSCVFKQFHKGLIEAFRFWFSHSPANIFSRLQSRLNVFFWCTEDSFLIMLISTVLTANCAKNWEWGGPSWAKGPHGRHGSYGMSHLGPMGTGGRPAPLLAQWERRAFWKHEFVNPSTIRNESSAFAWASTCEANCMLLTRHAATSLMSCMTTARSLLPTSEGVKAKW